ncbi:putative rhoptry protein [Plasmodium gaboni]|uniref:Putative rhoptry protein n=1 Tax=Plasmodium gaboni TaxID=647221 RepID=A0A151LBJ5_9APIC|nr:putative rhoptry protein [Plasmodium gaboni]KYN96257.1 putative rhoptry protein [Plasmodium gaboni]
MGSQDKEHKYKSNVELEFSDNVSDDDINIDKENIWDTDINIIDDELNIIDNDDVLNQNNANNKNTDHQNDRTFNVQPKQTEWFDEEEIFDLPNNLEDITRKNNSIENNEINKCDYQNEYNEYNFVGQQNECDQQNESEHQNEFYQQNECDHQNEFYQQNISEQQEYIKIHVDNKNFHEFSDADILFNNLPTYQAVEQNNEHVPMCDISKRLDSQVNDQFNVNNEEQNKHLNILLQIKNILNINEDKDLIKYIEKLNNMNTNYIQNVSDDDYHRDNNFNLKECLLNEENEQKVNELKERELYYLDTIEKLKNEIKIKEENEENNVHKLENKIHEYEIQNEELKSEKEKLQSTINEYTHNFNNLNDHNKITNKECEELKNNCDVFKQKYEKLKEEQEIYIKKEEEYKSLLDELKNENNEWKEKNQKLHEENMKTSEELKKFEEIRKSEDVKKMEVLENKINDLLNINDDYKVKLNQSNDVLLQFEKKLNNTLNDNKKNEHIYSNKIQTLENTIILLEEEMNCIKKENQEIINNYNELENDYNLLLNKNKQLNEEYGNLKICKEQNEQNIQNLKSNIQINEQEYYLNNKKLQEQNLKIENLIIENNKNNKMLELLKSEKLKMESENDILKKDLANMEEDLKKLEKHSYDIYEIKNHLEEVVDKNKKLIEDVELEKNEKEHLKNQVKAYNIEMNNSYLVLKTYKMKCSFFLNIIKNYEENINILENKLKKYEYKNDKINDLTDNLYLYTMQNNKERYYDEKNHSNNSYIIKSCDSSKNKPFDDEEKEEEYDEEEKYAYNILLNNQSECLIKAQLLLKEELDKEIQKKDEILIKLQKLISTLKEKNLIINEKNYKIKKYQLINENLQDCIAGYQKDIQILKENIHNLEKQIQLKQIKNLVLPPKVHVHVSKLSSLENNIKNELKGIIGNSSNFLENTFKYINENPLKKNLQNKTFFSTSGEKKIQDDISKQGDLNKEEVSNCDSVVDVTGMAKNFLYNNMNILQNFKYDVKDNVVLKNDVLNANGQEYDGVKVNDQYVTVDNERENNMYNEKEHNLFDEKEHNVFDEKENKIYDEKENNIFEEKEKNVYDEEQSLYDNNDPYISINEEKGYIHSDNVSYEDNIKNVKIVSNEQSKNINISQNDKVSENKNIYFNLFFGKKSKNNNNNSNNNSNNLNGKNELLTSQSSTNSLVKTDCDIKNLFNKNMKNENKKAKEETTNFFMKNFFPTNENDTSNNNKQNNKKNTESVFPTTYQTSYHFDKQHEHMYDELKGDKNEKILKNENYCDNNMNTYNDLTYNSELYISEEDTNKYDANIEAQNVMDNSNNEEQIKKNITLKNSEQYPQPNLSDEDPPISDVWNDKIDLDNFELENV